MAVKREHDESDEGEISEPNLKKARTQDKRPHNNQSVGIDPTWGQKYVFSTVGWATTIPPGEESDFEDDATAMAYLSSVR